MKEMQNIQEKERNLCLKCFRAKENCYCKYAKDVDSNIKFIFLMHPKEFKKQKTGTGRLASICLPESEIIMGIDFTNNEHLNRLLNDEQYFPVLMYPAPNALNAKSERLKINLCSKKLLVLIVDSTWFCSKKMLKTSENLKALPKLSFCKNYKSIFTFKKEPYDFCVSTIESCYYLIKELQEEAIVKKDVNPEPLMDIFKQMILFQLQKENERILSGKVGTHPKDAVYNTLKEIPDFKFSH